MTSALPGLALDALQEAQELAVPVALGAGANDGALEDVERGESVVTPCRA